MGKGTDKMYITASEHALGPGGAKRTVNAGFKRLPFTCCSLSLQPFEHPVCSPEGIIFDLVNIVPWIKKYGTNPVTGEKLEAKSLIKLHFHKSAEGKFHDPVTFKVFTDNTHIVAVKTSGNVYAYDTIETLNIKIKQWRDLLTDEPFTRKDIITIQDPHNLTARNITDFHYVKRELTMEDEETERAKRDPTHRINAVGTTSRVLSEMAEKDQSDKDQSNASNTGRSTKGGSTPTVPVTPSYVNLDRKAYNDAHYSTGAAAASLTSTAVPVQTRNVAATIDEEEYMFARVKAKGYIQIQTNLGNINLELFCADAPRACYNMIKLAKKDYYDGVKFHRSIKSFMLQGGDPTGTGRGGESIWGKPFRDEFKQNLSHSGRGILSMANKGKNTNTSQFFITYKSCPHLDNKHTVFGKVVGGLDVLSKIEKVPTDGADKPKEDIVIEKMTVFVDPFEDFAKELGEKLKSEADKEKREAERRQKRDAAARARGGEADGGGGVGKYMKSALSAKRGAEDASDSLAMFNIEGGTPKKKPKGTGFGDFSSW